MVGQRDAKFYSELKQMNEDFVAFLKEANDKSPYFDFTPTLNDYVKQIQDLEKQFPEKTKENNDASASKQTSMFNINASPFIPSAPTIPAVPSLPSNNSLPSQAPTSTFSFGLNTNTQPTFIFGATSNQTTTATSPSLFNFTLPKKPEENNTNNIQNNATEANEADDDDAPPPDPKIDRYEEPNAKHSVKCKLYEKVTEGSSATLLGIGFLYLKALDTPDKLQVIFRQEPDLRRVLLNEAISAKIPGQVKLLPKAVQLLFPNQRGEIKTYITKVKDDNDRNALFDQLNMTK